MSRAVHVRLSTAVALRMSRRPPAWTLGAGPFRQVLSCRPCPRRRSRSWASSTSRPTRSPTAACGSSRDAAVAHGRGSPPRARRSSTSAASRRGPAPSPCPSDEELRRVVPVIEALARHRRAALDRHLQARPSPRPRSTPAPTYVNDVTAFRADARASPGLVADRGVDCCLMHMLGEPRTMQDDPRYDDVVDDVKAFLEERAGVRRRARASREERIDARPGHRLRQDRRAQPRAAARASTRSSRSAARVVVGDVAQVLPRRAHRRATTRTTASPGPSPRTSSRSSAARASSASTTSPPARRCADRGGCYVARAMAPDHDDDDLDADDVDDDDGLRRGRRRRRPRSRSRSRGLSLYTHHGVTAAEREVGQRLVLDLRLDVGECDATVTDLVEDTVDYGEVCERRRARRPAALLQDARAPVHGDRRPPARRLRGRGGVGQGGQARAADPAARRGGLRRGLARARRRRRLTRAPRADRRSTARPRSRRPATARRRRRSTTAGSAPRGPNGGYIAAIVLRALDAERRRPRRARRARSPCTTCARRRRATAAVDVTVERAGPRRSRTLSARMRAGRRATASLALAAFARRLPDGRRLRTPRRAAAPRPRRASTPLPDGRAVVPPIAEPPRRAPGFGAAPFSGGDEALTGGWLRLAEPRAARRGRARALRRRLDAGAVRRLTRAGRRADDRPHHPLPRARRCRPARRRAGARRASRSRRRATASSRRTASCGRRTATLLAQSRQLALLPR